ncbi:MAG: MGMT family protein [Acidimicrobiia bacterium]|nr:MGMT family protein [Acidimicrobiia bacterium]
MPRLQPSADFEAAVSVVLGRLRPGDVVSYGEVAEEAGFPGAARAVGNVLARGDGLPWWRVVTADGRLVPGHERKQTALLKAEGIDVVKGKVRRAEWPT